MLYCRFLKCVQLNFVSNVGQRCRHLNANVFFEYPPLLMHKRYPPPVRSIRGLSSYISMGVYPLL